MLALELTIAIALCAVSAPPPDRSGPVVEAGVFAATPALLSSGQLLGPSAEVWFGAPTDWLRFAARARLGVVGGDDFVFHVEHTELRVSALASLCQSIGRGEIAIGAELGAIGLREVRTRHQADRLITAGLAAETSGGSLGAQAAIDASLRLFVLEGFGIGIDGGPNLSLMSASSGGPVRLGFSVGLAAAYAF